MINEKEQFNYIQSIVKVLSFDEQMELIRLIHETNLIIEKAEERKKEIGNVTKN